MKKKLSLILTFCLLFSLFTIAPIQAKEENFDSSKYYKLINRHSGQVLDVYAKQTKNGANVQQWSDNGGWNQHWKIVDVGNGYYKFINRNSGKVLDVSGWSKKNGGNITQWKDSNGANQHWKISSSGDYYEIKNRHSGKLLDVSAKSTKKGANVHQWTDLNGANQQWKIVEVGSSSSGSKNKANNDKGKANATETSKKDKISILEEEVVQVVNQERAKRGIPPLRLDPGLARVSRIKSADMRDLQYFSHTSPRYGSASNLLRVFNVKVGASGENIAAGQRSAQEVMNSWMNSDGHRENILRKEFTHIGVGFVEGGPYGTYWTQIFASR